MSAKGPFSSRSFCRRDSLRTFETLLENPAEPAVAVKVARPLSPPVELLLDPLVVPALFRGLLEEEGPERLDVLVERGGELLDRQARELLLRRKGAGLRGAVRRERKHAGLCV